MSEGTEYTLGHTNVDGAGIIGKYASFEAAKAAADRRQGDCDAHGNPWRYTYWVSGCGRILYRSRRWSVAHA